MESETSCIKLDYLKIKCIYIRLSNLEHDPCNSCGCRRVCIDPGLLFFSLIGCLRYTLMTLKVNIQTFVLDHRTFFPHLARNAVCGEQEVVALCFSVTRKGS